MEIDDEMSKKMVKKIYSALLKKSVGYKTTEICEEYVDDDTDNKKVKKKVNTGWNIHVKDD